MTVDFMPFFSNSKAARLFLLRLDLEKYCEVNNVCVGVPCLAHGVSEYLENNVACQIHLARLKTFLYHSLHQNLTLPLSSSLRPLCCPQNDKG